MRRASPRPELTVALLATLLLAAGAAQALQPAGAAQAAAPGTTLELEEPHGGWKVSGLTDKSEEFRSAYPYNLIDRGRVKGRSLVRGRFLRRPPAPGAAPRKGVDTIVLNGIAMPLFSDAGGEFVRPYAFGAGSNSVEVRANEAGGPVRRIQFYEAARDRAQAKIRIVLSWDDHQAEVDMHVVTPDGGHAYWADPILGNGAMIDPDGVDGPGPEIFTMPAPPHGPYQVWVNYWGNFGGSGYHFDEQTREKPVMTARVTLVTNENTPSEKQEFFLVPLRKIGEMTLVKSFRY